MLTGQGTSEPAIACAAVRFQSHARLAPAAAGAGGSAPLVLQFGGSCMRAVDFDRADLAGGRGGRARDVVVVDERFDLATGGGSVGAGYSLSVPVGKVQK
eukprot:1991407-Prymnesium_polylepis.1